MLVGPTDLSPGRLAIQGHGFGIFRWGVLPKDNHLRLLHRSESRWRNSPKGGLVGGHGKPIHGSCAIYFPVGIKTMGNHRKTNMAMEKHHFFHRRCIFKLLIFPIAMLVFWAVQLVQGRRLVTCDLVLMTEQFLDWTFPGLNFSTSLLLLLLVLGMTDWTFCWPNCSSFHDWSISMHWF